MLIYLPGNSNIKAKSCVSSYPFWMVRLGPDTAILSHCGRWFVAWCFEDTLHCWRLPQSNWFAAEQIWSLAEWMSWPELTTSDNRWWNYFIKTPVFHGVSLTVFHGCHLSQMELECVSVLQIVTNGQLWTGIASTARSFPWLTNSPVMQCEGPPLWPWAMDQDQKLPGE